VSAVEEGASINPSIDSVQMALVPTGTPPDVDDWNSAGWEVDETSDPDTYYARLLVGPGLGGVLTLTAGVIYDVYLKVNDNPETVVRNAGPLGVL
jgi:hypothetical protein